MSEAKWCPYRKVCVPKKDSYEDEELLVGLPCLREKCAMWRKDEMLYLPTGQVLRDNSYCGLAGKP